MKLRDTLLLSAAAGCFLLWILEYRRSSFADSYWLLLTSLGLLLAFQYFRIKQREAAKNLSPTIRQMAEDRQKRSGIRPSGIQPTASGKAKKK